MAIALKKSNKNLRHDSETMKSGDKVCCIYLIYKTGEFMAVKKTTTKKAVKKAAPKKAAVKKTVAKKAMKKTAAKKPAAKKRA
ncbi:MAG: hypothetical protein ACRD4P_06825 [Bryobacteraceae bacterium]